MCSTKSMTSWLFTSALLSHAISPLVKTQPMHHYGGSTHPLLSSFQPFQSQRSSNTSLSASTQSPFQVSSSSKMASYPSNLSKSPLKTLHAPAQTTEQICHQNSQQSTPSLSGPSNESRTPQPFAYNENLRPQPSPLCPHCLAQDHL